MEAGNYIVISTPLNSKGEYDLRELHFKVIAKYSENEYLIKCVKLLGEVKRIQNNTYYSLDFNDMTCNNNFLLMCAIKSQFGCIYKSYDDYCAKSL